jgi:peptide/nickel transport system substrate-binding protein
LAIVEEVVTQKYLSPGEQLSARVNVTIGGKPSNDAIVDYFLSDTDGKVILSGQVEPSGNRSNTPPLPHQQGVYEFSLNSSDTSKLKLGPNSLKIFANSEDAFRPDIFTIPLITFNREQ